MNKKEYSASAEGGGRSWNLSTGKLAPQASGSVLVRVGDTVVIANVVRSESIRDGIDYLPLLVDYEERLYAAGKIKGSRWVKREGRPTDEAILSGRVVDRCLRPMFDSRIRNDIQVVVTVLSVDGENDPDIIGLSAASAAVEVSDIPWDGPIAGVRVGRVDGQLILNPSFEVVESKSDLDLIVAGTAEHIIMVEAGAKEVSEEDIIGAVKFAQGEIAKIVGAIKALRKEAGLQKREGAVFAPKPQTIEKVHSYEQDLTSALYASKSKDDREKSLLDLRVKIGEEVAGEDTALKLEVNYLFEKMMKELIQAKILQEGNRVDGRATDEIRSITCEVGLLPRVHGSGLFRRGETQVLTTVTLG